jgi:hypothetical protein
VKKVKQTDENKDEEKPKKVIRRIVKKHKEQKNDEDDDNISIKSTISDKSILNTLSKIKKITKSENSTATKIPELNKFKILELNEFKIPDNYDYRQVKELTDIGKKILSEDKLNHIDIKKELLLYLKKNNKLSNDIEIENIKFSLKNIDKFISAYLVD